MNDDTGMIGYWPHGCVIINRKIYDICHHGFWPLGGFLVRKTDPDIDLFHLIGHTERVADADNEFGVHGVDVGAFLKIEMQGYHYRFTHYAPPYHHIGYGLHDVYAHHNFIYDAPIEPSPEMDAANAGAEERKQAGLKRFERFK